MAVSTLGTKNLLVSYVVIVMSSEDIMCITKANLFNC